MSNRLFLITLTCTLFTTSSAADLDLSPHVLAGIEQAIEDSKARAVAVGLYDNGEIQVTGFGQLSRAGSAVPGSDTLFEIGSITKVFTSLLTQTQVAADRLTWDDTIGSLLPELDFTSEAVASITLRELSTHTSGLPRVPDNMDPTDPLDPYMGYDRALLLSFLVAFNPDALVKEYAYSNLGAGLLGVIAADAAESSFSEAMQREVTVPLGMNDTGFEVKRDQSDRLARGFSAGADMPNWDGFDALAGAGALLSSVDDLLLFIRQNLDPQALQESLSAIREPQAGGETAFGWHIAEPDDDGSLYWHNGGTGGYASFLAFQPATGRGVVILSSSTEYDTITQLGFAQMSGETGGSQAENLDAYPGAYKIADGFVLSVSINSGQLSAQATGQAAFPLTASGDNEFVFPAADIKIVFQLDDSGNAEKLTLYQRGQATPAPRVGDVENMSSRPVIELSAAQLKDYVGEFQLTPAVVIQVMVRDGQVFAQLTGQAAYPVFPYEPDRFFYKVVDAQLHFERAGNRVTAVVLHQGGEQRAPRIE